VSRRLLFLVLLFLVGAAVACQGGEAAACNEGGALFFDDFRPDTECGWVLYNRSGASVRHEGETLRVTTSQPGQIWWTNAGRNFDDLILTADVQHIDGPEDNAYGLICRYQSSENFYVFLISSDGYYAIGKYQSGASQITYLNEGAEYVFSDAINQETGANRLRATCIGNELTLSVNGVLLESVNDPTFVTGDIGLAVSAFEPGRLEVAFDNVRAIAP
jgi:hypothetical protein